MLGRGAFGTVYRMINPHDKQAFAVKELNCLKNEDGSTDTEAMEELLSEVQKMCIVQSNFVVKYHTSAIYDDRFYCVMELIVSWCAPSAPQNRRNIHSDRWRMKQNDGAEYHDVVATRQRLQAAGTLGYFPDEQVKSWTKQIAMGLEHLHEACKLVHHDLHNGE